MRKNPPTRAITSRKESMHGRRRENILIPTREKISEGDGRYKEEKASLLRIEGRERKGRAETMVVTRRKKRGGLSLSKQLGGKIPLFKGENFSDVFLGGKRSNGEKRRRKGGEEKCLPQKGNTLGKG